MINRKIDQNNFTLNRQLTIQEKYSKHWPSIAWGSGVLSLLFLGTSYLTSHILMSGYLQLTSFCLFAVFLLGLLKVRDGRVEIDFSFENNRFLKIRYRVKDRVVDESRLDLSSIQSVEISRMPDKSLYNNINKSDRTLRYKDQDQTWRYLTELKRRVIPLSPDEARVAADFLNRSLEKEFPHTI